MEEFEARKKQNHLSSILHALKPILCKIISTSKSWIAKTTNHYIYKISFGFKIYISLLKSEEFYCKAIHIEQYLMYFMFVSSAELVPLICLPRHFLDL